VSAASRGYSYFMEALLWILLPGFAAVATGVLAWFVMQSRMEVALANQRQGLAETRGALESEKAAIKASFHSAIRAAEETARRQAFDTFLGEITVEQRHYTRENRLLMHNRKSLILQERLFFRNLPLSDWIEHEVTLDETMDVKRLVQDMTVFDKSVVNITDLRAPNKALA
jgi:hypothetical protein